MSEPTDAAMHELLSLCDGLGVDCERAAQWQADIALILDHPSIYMGGPSRLSLRRATKVLEYLAAQRLESRPSISGQEIDGDAIIAAYDALRKKVQELRPDDAPPSWADLDVDRQGEVIIVMRAALQATQKG